MVFVQILSEITEPKVSELGGKGYSLAVLVNKGLNVPKGFSITSHAFLKYLAHNNLTGEIKTLTSEIDEGNFQEISKKTKNLLLSAEVPKEIVADVKENLNDLNVQYVSVRSSSVSEDTSAASFAGLHDTFLNIRTYPDLVVESVKKCWASLFNERAVIYRIKKKISCFGCMAVIVQEMIPAEISGITFTVDPTDEKSIIVEASYGIGDIIVSGKVDPDGYTVDRETLKIKEKKIGRKSRMSTLEDEQVKTVEVEKDLAKKAVLCDNKIREIVQLCLKVQRIFNYPQDIEWCIYDGKVWLLQSRAITKVRK